MFDRVLNMPLVVITIKRKKLFTDMFGSRRRCSHLEVVSKKKCCFSPGFYIVDIGWPVLKGKVILTGACFLFPRYENKFILR